MTEHANRHPLTLREPSTNSEDISTHQKAPLPSRSSSPTTPNAQQKDITKRKVNKKCGFCTCLALTFLISCALVGILVIHFILSENTGDRESQEQRMKIVRRLLRETPLIGKYNSNNLRTESALLTIHWMQNQRTKCTLGEYTRKLLLRFNKV